MTCERRWGVDSLQDALKNDPDNPVAHYQLGLAFDMQHNDSRAESEWREAILLRPELTDAQRALAGVALRRGDLDGLTQSAQQIITAAPFSADGYILRALAEMNRQKYTGSSEDLRKAAELAPQSPVPYVQMGNLRLLQKQYAEAIKAYQQALDRDPSSTDALQGMMNTWLAQKQPDQAIAAARAQIAKTPNNSGFYDLLGTALFEKKDLSGAGDAFCEAIELDKNNSDALLKLGQVQTAQGSASQALATYEQSTVFIPRDTLHFTHSRRRTLRVTEIVAGSSQRRCSQKALQIQPDNPLGLK